ncbi:hypothetical protein LCGC14_2257430 [marine sediment metagenome]|uniref:Uncharacterized protein n=1 Tax=marine sediment metagenome TaxID=412755 RepID=A0A0F9FVS2_9ZZZZ
MLNKRVDFNGSHANVDRNEVCLRALSLLMKACVADNIDLDDYRIVLSIEKKKTSQDKADELRAKSNV